MSINFARTKVCFPLKEVSQSRGSTVLILIYKLSSHTVRSAALTLKFSLLILVLLGVVKCEIDFNVF